jgi:hypothetical protein
MIYTLHICDWRILFPGSCRSTRVPDINPMFMLFSPCSRCLPYAPVFLHYTWLHCNVPDSILMFQTLSPCLWLYDHVPAILPMFLIKSSCFVFYVNVYLRCPCVPESISILLYCSLYSVPMSLFHPHVPVFPPMFQIRPPCSCHSPYVPDHIPMLLPFSLCTHLYPHAPVILPMFPMPVLMLCNTWLIYLSIIKYSYYMPHS